MAVIARFYKSGFFQKLSDFTAKVLPAYTVIEGTEGSDKQSILSVDFPTVYGTPGNDVVYLYGGDDVYWASWGPDLQSSRAGGRDVVFAGSGNDEISGTTTQQLEGITIYGESGDDVIEGSNGILGDALFGGDNNDTISGRDAKDILDGGSGDDALHGGDGDDTLYGGSNNDVLWGDGQYSDNSPGADTLYGGSGDDELHGGPLSDKVYGGTGIDTFFVNVATDGIDQFMDFEPAVSIVGGDLISGDKLVFDFSGLSHSINAEIKNVAHFDLADDYIGLVYDTTRHTLWYDNGEESAYLLAQMNNGVEQMTIYNVDEKVITLIATGGVLEA